MTRSSADPAKWIPLTPAVFYILLALVEQDLHGYAIMQQVSLDTAGRFRMGAGTLYGSIKRMLAEGLIQEIGSPEIKIDEMHRRYYCITDAGREALQKESRRMARAVKVAQHRQILPARIRVCAPLKITELQD